MICETHGKWFRTIEGCPVCNEEVRIKFLQFAIEEQESNNLDIEIRQLEQENRRISLVLWER